MQTTASTRWLAIAGLAALGATATPMTVHADPMHEHPDAYLRAKFAKEIRCDGKDPNRYWCPVTRLGSEKLVLPKDKAVMVGFYTLVYDDRTVVKELDRSLSLAVLCLGTGDFQGKMALIEEQDEARTKLMAPVRDAARRALQGDSKSVTVSPAVYDELESECSDYHASSGEETLVDSSLAQDKNGTPLFKVGNSYVTLWTEEGGAAVRVAAFAAVELRKAGK